MLQEDGKIRALSVRIVWLKGEISMDRTERIRQSASEKLSWDAIQKFQSEGWKLVALEWNATSLTMPNL